MNFIIKMNLLFLILSLFIFASGEKANIEISLNRPNYFDEEFYIFSKTSSFDQIFGYSPEKVCIIRKDNYKGYTISIQDYRTFERSTPLTINFGQYFGILKPEACFNYNEFNYLIFRNQNINETSIFRGQNEKILKNLTFDLLKFDHVNKNLYLINKNLIYKMNLKNLEKLWKIQELKNKTEIDLKYIGTLPNDLSDYLILNDFVYFF